MPHLDDGLIHELLDGEVPSDRLPPIQAHLASCAACQARLDEERELMAESDQLIEALDDVSVATPALLPDIAPAPRRAAEWPRQLAWAASLALAVGLGYTAGGGLRAPDTVVDGLTAPSATTSSLDDRSAEAVAEEPAGPPPVASQAVPARERGTAATGVAGAGAAAPTAAPPQAAAERAAVAVDSMARRERADEARRDAALAPGRSEPVAQANRLAAARELVSEQDVAAKAALAADREVAGVAVGVPEGPLWRIVGTEPLRTEYAGDAVRLVYRHSLGEVVLVQRRVGTEMGWRLEVPPGFPADSLSALQGRVR